MLSHCVQALLGGGEREREKDQINRAKLGTYYSTIRNLNLQ